MVIPILCLFFGIVTLDGAPSAFKFSRPTPSKSHNLELTRQHGRILAQSDDCKVILVESMPENLTYAQGSPKHASTVFAWNVLLDQAASNLFLATFYWSLIAEPQYNHSAVHEGQAVYQTLLDKVSKINITVSQSGAKKKDYELDKLEKAGARIHWVDVEALLGQGVLHTKLWTVDRKHGYLGSANMDWRSLTEVKELGSLLLNCPTLVEDLDKIHATYWLASEGVPVKWPTTLETTYNRTHPLVTTINGIRSRVYISSSPSEFNPPGRTHDLEAILSIIAEAREYIYISVMDYSPEVVSYRSNKPGKYWPDIDDALRKAAIERGVEVRLLISRWPYTSPIMLKYLSSLRLLNNIHGSRIRIRYFIVPSFTDAQRKIPHARVNHNKYMVTDKTAYIGTSNWSGDYFLYTGGAALVFEEEGVDGSPYDYYRDETMKAQTLRIQLTDIFSRDWNSEYSFED